MTNSLIRRAVSIFAVVLLVASTTAQAASLQDGAIIVSGTSEVGTGLIAIDPHTGDQTLISEGSFGDFAIGGQSTIYALSGDAVVRINTATGRQRVLTAGHLLTHPAGIAVTRNRRIFVLTAGFGFLEIIEIAPSGRQSILTSHLTGLTDVLDLEATLDSDLVYLTRGCVNSHSSCVLKVDRSTGDSTLLLTASPEIGSLMLLTGLGVGPSGDIYWASHGFAHDLTIITINDETGEVQIVGGIIGSVPGTSPPRIFELIATDIAVGDDGRVWLTGRDFFGRTGPGLYRAGPFESPSGSFVRPVVESDGLPFAIGDFSEVQVFKKHKWKEGPGKEARSKN